MPTNEQRRATAKRKLERQLERRAAQERKRRLYTIIGSAVAAIAVVAAVVATVVVTNRDSDSTTARRPRPRRPRSHQRRRRRPRDSCPPFKAPADLGADCQYPAATGAASKPNKPPRTGKVPDRPGADQRQHVDQPGQHRPAARQRQVAVHGQQLRQPGPAGLLQRHPVPPADHQPRGCRCCSAATRRARAAADPGYQFANEYPTNQFQPDDPQAAEAGDVSARHAGDGQRRAPAPTAASSSWSTRIRSCRRTTRCSARSTRPAWPRWTRSPRPASPAEARTASRSHDVQVKSIGWTDAADDHAAAAVRRVPAATASDPRGLRLSAAAADQRAGDRVADLRVPVRTAGHHLRPHLAVADQAAPARRAAGWRWPGWSSAT